jgi:hypothetical protein
MSNDGLPTYNSARDLHDRANTRRTHTNDAAIPRPQGRGGARSR